jgi:hypothetical protein
VLGLGSAPGGDFQNKTHMAVLHHQALDHVLLHNGAPAKRVHNLVERLENFVAGGRHGSGYNAQRRQILVFEE